MSDNDTGVAYYTYSPICGGGNDYDGRLGLHVAAIFVILVTSAFGNSLQSPRFILISRCFVSSICQKAPPTPCTRHGVHIRQVFWIWRHYCNGFHSSPRFVFHRTGRPLSVHVLGCRVSLVCSLQYDSCIQRILHRIVCNASCSRLLCHN